MCGGDWVVWAFMPFYVQNYFYCLYIQLGMFNIYISICRLKMYMVDYTMQPKSVQSDRRKQRKGLCYSLLANTSMPIMHFDFGATPCWSDCPLEGIQKCGGSICTFIKSLGSVKSQPDYTKWCVFWQTYYRRWFSKLAENLWSFPLITIFPSHYDHIIK